MGWEKAVLNGQKISPRTWWIHGELGRTVKRLTYHARCRCPNLNGWWSTYPMAQWSPYNGHTRSVRTCALHGIHRDASMSTMNVWERCVLPCSSHFLVWNTQIFWQFPLVFGTTTIVSTCKLLTGVPKGSESRDINRRCYFWYWPEIGVFIFHCKDIYQEKCFFLTSDSWQFSI